MTKTLKRVIALLSVSMFMALFSLSCFAQENSSAKKIYTEDLGDGITAVVTLSETNGMARSSKTYNVTKEYYKDGTYIGVATLLHSYPALIIKSVASISPVMVTYCCKYYYSIYTYRSGTSLCWAIDV